MTRRIAATALAACCLALVSAAPGWAKGTIQWHGCGRGQPASLQCGKLSVPLDYSHPRGAKITLGFNRLRAQDQTHRVGSLIVNPGGPGGPGSQVVAVEAAGRHLWHPALHQRFDLIGMDPRGTGTSTPVRCKPDTYNRPVSLFPRTAAEFQDLTAWAGAFGRSCLRMTGPLLRHVDTDSAARDMERLRRALGDGKLNFLGLSYGAHLGFSYAERYPKRIRAMALDGISNHSTSINTLFSDAAASYEDTLNRFAAWCSQTSSCALNGRDVLGLFDSLVQQADQQPIPAPECADGSCRPAVTGGELRMNAFNMLLVKDGVPAIGVPTWNDFATALARAEQGDASSFSSHFAQSARDDPFPGLSINCSDYPRDVVSYTDFRAKALLGRVLAPHTQGASEAWLGILGCMRWPVPLANPPHRAEVHGAPPILVAASTHDPSTPYVWAQELRDQIPRAVLLTRDGDGHTSSWLGGGRTRDAIANYLITRKPPPANTVYPD
ncbi:MAG TPA: alpha/beta hydrolase [Baekduia sp.]|uniref:alpha/beta hydrolase n=1 Tax=Baekduia sp. TaxID=2600305 RepID=UPI002BB2AAB0|nr:alpha/beta hydrolase [Baekduia sp.]HMJ34996.1 alpha/beta hydrolase [Baekduia sp.]